MDFYAVAGHAVDRVAKFLFQRGHALKIGGEVLPDSLPVVHAIASLDASDAVVVAESELIHGRQFDSRLPDDVEAFSLADSMVDERAFNVSLIVLSLPEFKAIRFIGGVSEDFNVAHFPHSSSRDFFHHSGAWRSLRGR